MTTERKTNTKKRILVAGVGNIFFGDDAFGIEVVRHLAQVELPEEVRVVDFGIRSYDLAYAMMDGNDATILVDATRQGHAPGSVCLIQPDVDVDVSQGVLMNAHGMTPTRVLQLVHQLGGKIEMLYVVGCEPAVLDTDTGHIGLSEPVQNAIPVAIEVILSLIREILENTTSDLIEAV